MEHLGAMNTLRVLRKDNEGVVLDGGVFGELSLASAELRAFSSVPEEISVFLYRGPGNKVTATTFRPKAVVGEVAHLRVVTTKDAGAFLEWGLPKDLLLPWREVRRDQKHFVEDGRWVLVAVFLDEDDRITASAKLDEFISDQAEGYSPGQKVQIIASDPTDLGMRVIVDHRHWGLVHHSDIYGSLKRGDVREAFVKRLRADLKLDISLAQPGYGRIDGVAQGILDLLEEKGGFLPITDKSAPEEIYRRVGVSKKAFKQAVGALYKERRILLEAEGIRLNSAFREDQPLPD